VLSSFFPSEAPHVDIQLPDDPPPLPSRTFTPIADEEIRAMLLEASNVTAPGESGITWRLIKRAFDIASTQITIF